MERWSLMKGKYAMKEGRLDELREQLNQQKAVLETIEGRPRNQRQGIVNCRETIAVIEGKIKEIEELRVFYELDENNLFVVETTPGEVRYVATAANLNKTIPTYPKETPAMERTLAVFLEHERSPGVKVHVLLMMIRFDFFIDDGKHHNPNRGRVHVKYISGGPLLPRPGGGGGGGHHDDEGRVINMLGDVDCLPEGLQELQAQTLFRVRRELNGVCRAEIEECVAGQR
jgi:hypothetical protein